MFLLSFEGKLIVPIKNHKHKILFMKSLPTLTPQQAGELLAFQRASKQSATTYLNPSDPTHRKFIESMLNAAGRTPANYPYLYKALNTGDSYKGAPGVDNVRMVDAGKTAAGKATATVWSRSSNDSLIKGGNLMVFDSDTGALLAQGENTAVKRGFLACPARSATAAPAGKNLSLLYMGHTTDANGSTRFYSYTNKVAVAQDGIKANIAMPVIQHTGNVNIWIAVGRVAGSPFPSNTDYIFIEPSANENNPYLIVPFKGNVALSGLIDLPSLTIADLSTSIFVNNGHGSTVEITRATQYTTDAKMIGAFSVGTPANVLQWEFPYDQKGYQQTNSIVYNSTSLGNEIDSYFYFAFNGIPLKGGATAPPFFVCSKNTPEDPSINCTQIPNLYFWWHCLAKGTLVTLEDGSKKPIEAINETFRVKTGTNGSSFAVCATALGRHSSDPAAGTRKEIFRLTTANGKSITATENHMVFMTADKCRSISHLVAGDKVMTDEGMSTVKSIEAIAYNDMFYALALGNVKEQAEKSFPHNMANYYANGILCGDQLAMRHHCNEAHHDLEYMLPRIKQELHTDYASALHHKRF